MMGLTSSAQLLRRFLGEVPCGGVADVSESEWCPSMCWRMDQDLDFNYPSFLALNIKACISDLFKLTTL